MSELLDNQAHRIRTLKEIIKRLHQGDAPQHVKAQLKDLVKRTDAAEIAAMEQELIAEGMSVQEVQSMCDLHAEVVREIMQEPKTPEIVPGHPVETFRRENEALAKTVEKARTAMQAITAMKEGDDPSDALFRWRSAYNELMDVEKHYQRKEHLLFSCLERHGISGPSKVMWGKDDETRKALKALGEALASREASLESWKSAVKEVGEPALRCIEEMIYKEENILLPMALDTLTEDEWGEIWSQSPQYGWCLVEPNEGYKPQESASPPPTAELPSGKSLMFPTGNLNFEQIQGIFAALPVDLTFVDADDRVRYFSEGAERVFARSKAILGRKVQHCHPPKSVDVVEQIVSDFRNKKQDVAEFWINFQGKFVHIRYYAVRDPQGEYLGTLEVTQDLTHIRSLEGERRLLEYDSPPKP